MEVILLTPEMAAELLEHNGLNRPLSDGHVQRIARQILDGKWRFNGDTIKVGEGGDILDGQHRLWAIIEAKKPVETILVRGIHRDAFATVDTLRRPRSGADILSLCGASRYRQATAMALTWLLRWQRTDAHGRTLLPNYKAPQNRIENSDVEAAFVAHPGMVQAVERASRLKRLANVSIMGFLYYVFSNHNNVIADRMMDTLENPAGVGVNDPFFRLRTYFTADHHQRKEPLVTIALAIKAANAVSMHKPIQSLSWRQSGKNAEEFPRLQIG